MNVGQTRGVRILYRGGAIYPGAPYPGAPSAGTGEPLTSLLVDGPVISWIGSSDAAASIDADRVIELDGALLTPAFVDAHVHATATGLALTGVDLSGVSSLRAALDLLERSARTGRGRPVLGSGWDETGWPEGRPPTAAELDRAGYGGLVYLSRVDAHSAVVSSALLAAVPAARTLAGYRPDGHLRLRAHDAVRAAALSMLSAGQLRAAQRATRARAAELGIACLHEMGGPVISSAADFAGLLQLANEEPGPQVLGYWGELMGIDRARELGAVGAGGDLFCDGSLGSHTAALREPYADRPDTSGQLNFEAADIAEHLRRCAAAGLQAGFHAIGDAAVDAVLAGAELASARLGRRAGAGHRLEHAEMVADPVRLAAAGFTASVQPAFDANWGGAGGMYATRLGPLRAGGLNRFAELAAAGVELALGSDSPVTPLAPWAAIRAATHPHDPRSALGLAAAFSAHTRGGWRAAGDQANGRLAVGAPATLALWRTNESTSGLPDVGPGQRLPQCVQTVLNGQVIFDALS